MEKNLTTGSVFKTLLAFSLPYLFSYFLQTLYGMADLFIIGQFDPVAHITAVSIGSQVMHMLTVMIVGLAMGSTVTIAQSVGAGQKRACCALTTGNTRHAVYDRFCAFDDSSAVFDPSDCHGHVYPGRSCPWYHHLSDNLLPRNSLYYCIQCDQFHFPWNGRFQKPHVFYRDCLCFQYYSGLSFYRIFPFWSCRSRPWNHSVSGDQCPGGFDFTLHPSYRTFCLAFMIFVPAEILWDRF